MCDKTSMAEVIFCSCGRFLDSAKLRIASVEMTRVEIHRILTAVAIPARQCSTTFFLPEPEIQCKLRGNAGPVAQR